MPQRKGARNMDTEHTDGRNDGPTVGTIGGQDGERHGGNGLPWGGGVRVRSGVCNVSNLLTRLRDIREEVAEINRRAPFIANSGRVEAYLDLSDRAVHSLDLLIEDVTNEERGNQ